MSKIKSVGEITYNADKWTGDFSFIIESDDGVRIAKVNATATGQGARKMCSAILLSDIGDDKKVLECWREKVKNLWLFLDEDFVFSKEIHSHEDSSRASDFERLSQKNNDGSYQL